MTFLGPINGLPDPKSVGRPIFGHFFHTSNEKYHIFVASLGKSNGFLTIWSSRFENAINCNGCFCARFANDTNYNGFLVPDSKITQITMVFVPDSKMPQITVVFLAPIQTCYKLQWFFCSRFENARNYIGFFVPDSKMTQIALSFLSPTQKGREL